MHNIKIKIYNPETGRRFPIIPPLPLGLLPFAVKVAQKFVKKANEEVDISDASKSMGFSLDKFSKAEAKFLAKELKSFAPFTIVDIKENGKPVVNISIT